MKNESNISTQYIWPDDEKPCVVAQELFSRWILSLLKRKNNLQARALKAGFISKELLTGYCKLIGHKYRPYMYK
ncbi:hypothetical protein H5410_046845, partial [Solanum commersonii]